eukprot:COSAG06_NODE_52580_length_305_cov_0.456311_1_plen_77_part_10
MLCARTVVAAVISPLHIALAQRNTRSGSGRLTWYERAASVCSNLSAGALENEVVSKKEANELLDSGGEAILVSLVQQ